MRDKERIENGEIRVIKWERIWNNDREDKKERGREKAMNDTYCNFELSRWKEQNCYNCKVVESWRP